jgi:hypothetical protein
MKLNYLITIQDTPFDQFQPDDLEISIVGSIGDGLGIDVRTPGNININNPELGPAAPLQRDMQLAHHLIGRFYHEAPQLLEKGNVFFVRVDLAVRQEEAAATTFDVKAEDIIDADDSDPEQEHDGGINSAHLSVH